jgi:hypothetical protein
MEYSDISSEVESTNDLHKLFHATLVGVIQPNILSGLDQFQVKTLADKRGITEVTNLENVEYSRQLKNRHKVYDFYFRQSILSYVQCQDDSLKLDLELKILSILADFKSDTRSLVKQIINHLFFGEPTTQKFYVREIKYTEHPEDEESIEFIDQVSISSWLLDIELYFPKLKKVANRDESFRPILDTVADHSQQKLQKVNHKSNNKVLNSLIDYYRTKYHPERPDPDRPFLWVPLSCIITYKGFVAKVTTNGYKFMTSEFKKILKDLEAYEVDDTAGQDNNKYGHDDDSVDNQPETNFVYGLTSERKFVETDPRVVLGLKKLAGHMYTTAHQFTMDKKPI